MVKEVELIDIPLTTQKAFKLSDGKVISLEECMLLILNKVIKIEASVI